MKAWHAKAQDMRTAGYTFKEISDQCGVSETAAKYAASHIKPTPAGLDRLYRRRSENGRRNVAKHPRTIKRPDNDPAIIDGYARGAKVREIAKTLGVNRNVVIGRAHRLGLVHGDKRASAPIAAE